MNYFKITFVFACTLILCPVISSAEDASGTAVSPLRRGLTGTAQPIDAAAEAKAVDLIKFIDLKRNEFEGRLAMIKGHAGTKASVRYPFDLARVIDSGRRNFNEYDLGINEKKELNRPNFGEMIKTSGELLASLEAGTDPLWQAKGDLKRHYWFEEAHEIMPYRIYVPPAWDGKTALPAILILHGNTRDQDFYFERDGGKIPKFAQTNGYLLISPLAYRPNAGYNSANLQSLAGGNSNAPVAGKRQSPTQTSLYSEKDAINVFELVKKEYPLDPKRTFLFGYSAGGAGALYFGPKYAQNWAAMAAGGSNIGPGNYPFDLLKEMPVHLFFGDKDSAGVLQGTRDLSAAMKASGIQVDLAEYQGYTHDTAPGAAIPHLFEFFNSHPRK
ncbi:MAG: hypothetical protein JWN25_3192 [Verrucomicrobiales bacterium]|nr:hypothetical protein [Verrucomicrobiales bacterium]